MHRIGLHLHRKTEIPWLADFRDPWTSIDFYHELKLSKWADKKHHRMEAEVLREADAVSVIGWTMGEEMKKLVKRDYDVITNGFDTEDSFNDDPLRALRAARFAAQLGFAIDPSVITAMKSIADRLSIISAERMRDEFVKILISDNPRVGITMLVETGLCEKFLPEIPKLQLEIDEHHRHKDVYEHTLTVVEQSMALEEKIGGPNLILRLAALMHDVGKPKTRALIPGGGVSFHHHEVVGSRMTKERLRQLRFDHEIVNSVAKLVFLHLRFHGYGGGEWTDSAVRRYVRDAGELLQLLHVLTRADCTTRNQRKAEQLATNYDNLESRISALMEEEELLKIRPDLDGHQIMEILNVPAGPLVGKAYEFLLELRIEEGPLGEERAKDELLKWWSDNQS